MSEQKIGMIMARYGYAGTIVGIIGGFAYLKLFKSQKSSNLAIAGFLVLGGLAIGSSLGKSAVEREKKKWMIGIK